MRLFVWLFIYTYYRFSNMSVAYIIVQAEPMALRIDHILTRLVQIALDYQTTMYTIRLSDHRLAKTILFLEITVCGSVRMRKHG